MEQDDNLANLVFRLWVEGEEKVILSSASVYDIIELTRNELAKPQDNLFPKYRTEDEVKTALDRLVPSQFERDTDRKYQPSGNGVMIGISRRLLPEPYNNVTVSLVAEWKERWKK